MRRALIASPRTTQPPIIACFPPYPPVELFAAMGIEPVVLWNLRSGITDHQKAGEHIQNFVCSIALDLVQFLLEGPAKGDEFQGLFTYNACDTLRNISDIFANLPQDGYSTLPVFRAHLPQVNPAQSPQPEYLRNEIAALIKSLEDKFDCPFLPERFLSATRAYNQMRYLCMVAEDLVAQGRLSFGKFAGTVLSGYRAPVQSQILMLKELIAGAKENGACSGRKVVLSGIMPPPPALIRAMERAGLCIAANDIASLGRSYGYSPEPSVSPEEYYEDLFANRRPCTTLLYQSDRRVDHIVSLAEKAGAQGVIFVGEKFCENEYFEFPFIEARLKATGLPALFLEMSVNDSDHMGAYITRVEAFAEMI